MKQELAYNLNLCLRDCIFKKACNIINDVNNDNNLLMMH